MPTSRGRGWEGWVRVSRDPFTSTSAVSSSVLVPPLTINEGLFIRFLQ